VDLSFATLVAAFGGGIVSFITPCVLPLLPAYLSMMSGYSVDDMAAGKTSSRRMFRVTGLFVLGFSVVFVAAGAAASQVSRFITANQRVLGWVGGSLILAFGLLTLGMTLSRSRFFGFLNREARLDVRPSRLGGWAPPVMGLAFGFGWTPCIGPILGTILTVAAAEETVGQGALLLAVYAAGLGIPFIASGVATGAAFKALKKVRRHLPKVNLASGLVLVVFGLLLITGGFNAVRTAITDVWYQVPFLRDLEF